MSENTEDAVYVASALERYADEYKQNVDAPYFLRTRKVVIDYLLAQLRPNSRVLDMNCGTGVDIVEIAKQGHWVQGYDVSSAMISYARENISNSGLSHVAEAEVCDYRRLPAIHPRFDAILSNFGGINFAGNLEQVFLSVDRNLKEGGIFIINSVSHFCLAESIIFLTSGNFGKAFRRLAGGNARIGGKWVKLFYHRKKSFLNIAKKFGFYFSDIFGLNIIAPPLWADDFFTRHKKFASALERIDGKFRGFPLLRTMGDFTVLVFKKGRL